MILTGLFGWLLLYLTVGFVFGFLLEVLSGSADFIITKFTSILINYLSLICITCISLELFKIGMDFALLGLSFNFIYVPFRMRLTKEICIVHFLTQF